MSPTTARAPSAVRACEMMSEAVRIEALMPRADLSMPRAMARPAASSLAPLTRRPEERRSTAVARLIEFFCSGCAGHSGSTDWC